MNTFPKPPLDLISMLGLDHLNQGQVDICDYLERAENDPAMQIKLAEYLEKHYGMVIVRGGKNIQVLEKDHDKPEDVVKFWREAIFLGALSSIPKKQLN